MDSGAIEEVAAHETLSKTCEKAIGVRDIQSHLRGEITRERCQELIYFATCQYAKRQRTWFSKEKWIHRVAMDNKVAINHILRVYHH
jgi:tRNA dimethylallyltransferase